MSWKQSALLLVAACACVFSLRVEDVPCNATCDSRLSCSLNGDCVSGACVCSAAWTGPCCSSLALLPVSLAARSGYRAPNVSTWGGNIFTAVQPGDDAEAFHMLIAEMAPANAVDGSGGSCGLTTWSRNSQITHVVSAAPEGPYTRASRATAPWSHNPLVRPQPDGTLVLYHIGSAAGGATDSCSGNGTSACGQQSFDTCNATACVAVPGYSCAAGFCSAGDGASAGDCGADLAEPVLACASLATCAPLAAAACAATPGCKSFGLSAAWGLGKAKLFSSGASALTPNEQWSMWVQAGAAGTADAVRARERSAPPPALAPDGSCMLQMHTASAPDGPWLPYTNASISPCGQNNPGPYNHPNGTVFAVFTESDMGLWRADTWRGPYTLVTSGACGGGEDPSLYITPNGDFHCLFHRAPFSDPDIAIGHSYSEDGITWYSSLLPAANSSIAYEGLGVVVHGKRERPHLYLNKNGDISHFVSGVCIIPDCNPLEGTIDPAADCSSAAQYHNCDANSPNGWYDRTYTLVQGVRTPTPSVHPSS